MKGVYHPKGISMKVGAQAVMDFDDNLPDIEEGDDPKFASIFAILRVPNWHDNVNKILQHFCEIIREDDTVLNTKEGKEVLMYVEQVRGNLERVDPRELSEDNIYHLFLRLMDIKIMGDVKEMKKVKSDGELNKIKKFAEVVQAILVPPR